jgi:RNA polymerase-binding transcription factor DksA
VSWPDSLEEVQLAEVRELEIDGLDRRVGLLREVEDALSQLSDGSFGVCRLCDAKIKPTQGHAFMPCSHIGSFTTVTLEAVAEYLVALRDT